MTTSKEFGLPVVLEAGEELQHRGVSGQGIPRVIEQAQPKTMLFNNVVVPVAHKVGGLSPDNPFAQFAAERGLGKE